MLDAKVHAHYFESMEATWNDTKNLKTDIKSVMAMAQENEATAEKTLQVSQLSRPWLQV
jgi:hypothetical protein